MRIANEPEQMFVHCGKCGHEWSLGALPMPIATMAKVGKKPCIACGSKKVFHGLKPRDTKEGDPLAWLTESNDTGISSKTIWHVMMGRPYRDASVPYDPADFGRCHRLLAVMPSWRPRLGEVADKYPRWRPLVDAWDEVTALYLAELPTGMARRTYDRIKQLIDPERAEDRRR